MFKMRPPPRPVRYRARYGAYRGQTGQTAWHAVHAVFQTGSVSRIPAAPSAAPAGSPHSAPRAAPALPEYHKAHCPAQRREPRAGPRRIAPPGRRACLPEALRCAPAAACHSLRGSVGGRLQRPAAAAPAAVPLPRAAQRTAWAPWGCWTAACRPAAAVCGRSASLACTTAAPPSRPRAGARSNRSSLRDAYKG